MAGGENCEGYCAYNNTALHFKDAVEVMHPFIDFMFDQSLGQQNNNRPWLESTQNEEAIV